MQLLLSQKNAIFDEIEFFKFSPSQFSFNAYPEVTIIKLINTDYHFEIKDTNNYNFSTVEFSPGEEYFSEAYTCQSWPDTLHRFSLWLDNLKRETQLEDKWERLQQEIESIEIPFSNDNSTFTVSEFEILRENFKLIKTKILNIGLTEPQNEIIISKLDFLLEQSKTMNKFDWKSLFIGTIITIIIQLSLSQEQGTAIWNLIKEVFKNYLLP